MTISSTPGAANVLVRRGVADGSGWEGVDRPLNKNGHDVRVAQNPTRLFAGDDFDGVAE